MLPGFAGRRQLNHIRGMCGDRLTVETGPASQTVVIDSCCECDVRLACTTAKVILQNCEKVTVKVESKVMTGVLEVISCSDVTCAIAAPVHTVQVDMSQRVALSFAERAQFAAVTFNQSRELGLTVGGDRIAATGLDESGAEPLPHEQFVLQYVGDALAEEKVVRLGIGFPSTAREIARQQAIDKANGEKLERFVRSVVDDALKDKSPAGEAEAAAEAEPAAETETAAKAETL